MDDFNRWKIDDLKKSIKERGHKTTYRVKRELVAVAFALNQQNLPIVANVGGLDQVDVDYCRPCLRSNQMVRLTCYRIRII